MDAKLKTKWVKALRGGKFAAEQIVLVNMNDTEKKSFKQIATYIEQHIPASDHQSDDR